MKKYFCCMIYLMVFSLSMNGQIRVNVSSTEYHNGDTYTLYLEDGVLKQTTTSYDSCPRIGKLTTPKAGGGYTTSEYCGIRVINILQEVGEDIKANNQGEFAEIRVSMSNSYDYYCHALVPNHEQYCTSSWNNYEYEVVRLDNSVVNLPFEQQWSAVMGASTLISKKYNEVATLDVKTWLTDNIEKITIGIRAKYSSNPFASSTCIFGFQGTKLQDEPINITVENFFTDGLTDKKIKAQANSYPTSESTSPVNFYGIMTRRSVYAEALDKPSENYCFNDNEQAPNSKSSWAKYDILLDYMGPLGTSSSSANQSFQTRSAEKGYHYRALMKRYYDLTFVNTGHSMTINYETVSSPNTPKIVEANTVVAYGEGLITVNGIEKQFDHWVNNAGQSKSSPIIAEQTDTYTAVYRFYQAAVPLFTFGTTMGQPVTLLWSDNPDTNVISYKIYRRVFTNGIWGANELIGTVGRNVGLFSDPTYVLGMWKNDILLEYGMSAYYAPENHWSQTGWQQNYGHIGLEKKNPDFVKNELPNDFELTSYPNPFNPMTTINYQLPKDGTVSIKVYDIIGKEVATLVNEQKSAGYYKIDFDASKLTSGVYICSIQANTFNKSIKLLLTK